MKKDKKIPYSGFLIVEKSNNFYRQYIESKIGKSNVKGIKIIKEKFPFIIPENYKGFARDHFDSHPIYFYKGKFVEEGGGISNRIDNNRSKKMFRVNL